MAWLLVFLGGGLGSLCRYGIAVALPAVDLAKGEFPWHTLLANALACLVLGGLIGLGGKELLSRQLNLLLVAGFCGGFSTFSTFSAELLGLFEAGYHAAAVVYAAASLAVGLLAVFIAMALLR